MNPQQYTIKAQETINRAQNLVQVKGQQSIEVAHLLLAILAEDTEVIKFIAGKIGANISHLQAVLEKQVDQYLKVEGGSVYASPELNQTFVNAQKAMHELGDEFITNEHLIIGILEGKNIVSTVLKDAGFKRTEVIKAIKEFTT
jgi:ATP-dependent Clp protease ATP-binding subunit ClpB